MVEQQQAVAGTQAHAGAAEHAVPSALGFDATMLVSLAMLIVIGLAIWQKVPALIAKALDGKIAAIREQLDVATRLRAEAEAIKADYEARALQAVSDAEAMRKAAEDEAKAIVAQAKSDAAGLIARRTQMAQDKIAAAERGAIAEVRALVAGSASAAAASLIAAHHDRATDKPLIDATIAGLN